MIENEVSIALRKRYENLNPLVFHRSLEKADNELELFDILESIPDPPFHWDENNRKWVRCSDFITINKIKSILKLES